MGKRKAFLLLVLSVLLVGLIACHYELPNNPKPDDIYYGEGYDGHFTVYSGGTGTVINTVCAKLNSACLSGDNFVALSSTVGFKVHDEIFIYTAQGIGAGTYEFQHVERVEATVLTLKANLKNSYPIADAKTFVYRVPHYRTVTVRDGAKITAAIWSPDSGGGVVVFRAQESVYVLGDGSIDVTGKGYQGHSRDVDNANGYQGEGNLGMGVQDTTANGNGGGGGFFGYGGGGGGGHAIPGMDGIKGGPEGDTTGSLGGTGGSAIGNMKLSLLFFGGAGGTGGDNDSADTTTLNGGHGGGIIFITAPLLVLQNTKANGGAGNSSTSQDGGAGGGAGGSIFLSGKSVQITGTLSALGGDGFTPPDLPGGKGGDGAYGRIRISGQLTNNGIIYPSPYTN